MHRASRIRFTAVLLTGLGLLLAAVYVSLTNGVFDLTLKDVAETLFRIHPTREHDLVVFSFRLPRIVIAVLVGLGLGIAGAVIQGITRNGLADPGLLGINSGAGVAIVLFMFFFQGQVQGTGWLSALMMPMFGLVGGVGASLIIYMFSWKNGSLDPQRLLLTGIAVGSGLGALSLFISLKMKASDFEMATVWVSGSIWSANWKYIVSMLPWFIFLLPVIFSKAHILDLFQLEESTAKALGVATEREKTILLLSSIGVVSACVSVSGSIGFVGLIVPHIARRLVGVHHSRVLPVSGIIGMLLVTVSDFIAKNLFSPVEIPVGIIISLVGVPYFVYLLFKSKA